MNSVTSIRGKLEKRFTLEFEVYVFYIQLTQEVIYQTISIYIYIFDNVDKPLQTHTHFL